MRSLPSTMLFMAHPLALSYVIALLITSADASLQIEASGPDENDCQFGECYGSDMFPEKFDPLIPDYGHKAGPESESGAGSGGEKISREASADLGLKHEDRAQPPSEEMKLLVAMQKRQMERFDLLSDTLQNFMDKLETVLLRSSERAVPDDRRSPHSAPKIEGRSYQESGILSENSAGPSQEYTHADKMNVQKKEEAKSLESSPLISEIFHEDQQRLDLAYVGGMTVARYRPAWSEHFQFLSAVKVDGEVTCFHILPHEGEEGLSKYVAAGVSTGRVYIFLSHGDLLVDFQTASNLPITAILSYSVRRNETAILTGHSDGSILMHKLWEVKHIGPLLGEEWSTLRMEPVQALSVPSPHDHSIDATLADQEPVKGAPPHGSIRILEAYRVGRLRYILASDSEGNIDVFRDNGTFYGNAKVVKQPLAFLWSPNSQRLLFLTHDGVSSLNLRSLGLRTGPCEGLDGSSPVSYTFDATGRSKAYGFTDEGHMIYVALSGDSLHFECHVRSKRKLHIGNNVTVLSIKGYLLVVTPTQVLVYNTTMEAGHSLNSISVGVPRLLFASSLDELSMPFLNGPIQREKPPVITCNRERLVVLGFGDGYVGMYKSTLPVHRSGRFSSRTWSSPLIIIVLMFLGGWFFFGKKRDTPLSISDLDMALTPSSTATPAYRRSAMDAPLETLADSRRYASRADAFPGSATGSYGAGALNYGSSVTQQRFRAQGESPFIRSTSEETSLRSSLEPYFQREPADSKFRVAKIDEATFQNPLAESGSYSRRELDVKAARGSSSLHPRMKHLQEPNSF